MIKISESAAKKIVELKKEDGASEKAMLRVLVKRGGCSGFSYKLDFDESVNDGDKTFSFDGTATTDSEASIVIDSKSLLYVLGMTLEYEGGLNGNGFIFSNPNATKTCGCGASFAV